MSTPSLRPFRPEDLEKVMNRDGTQVPQHIMLSQISHGPAMTAVLDGEPIGCGGVVILWPGVGHAWMVLSEAMAPHAKWMVMIVRAFLRDIVRNHRLHRLEAEALEDSPRNQLWMERLGFTREVNGRANSLLPDRRSMIRFEMVDAWQD